MKHLTLNPGPDKDWTPLSAWATTEPSIVAEDPGSSAPAGPALALPELAEPLTDDQILSQVMQYPSDDLSKELGHLFDAAVNESTTSESLPANGPVEVLDTQALPVEAPAESPPAAEVASIPTGEAASPAETALDTMEEGGGSQPALEGNPSHDMRASPALKDKLVRSGAVKDIRPNKL